ncbi:MAG: hypothetical protein ABI400_03350 [Lacisediminihabitans sp.]
MHDFSPDSRRSAFSSTSELAVSDLNPSGAQGEPTNLEYHTQQGSGRRSEVADTDASSSAASSIEEVPTAAAPAAAVPETTAPVAATPVFATPAFATPVFATPASAAPVFAEPSSALPMSAAGNKPPAAPDSVSELPAPELEMQQPPAERALTRRELRALRQSGAPIVEQSTNAADVESRSSDSAISAEPTATRVDSTTVHEPEAEQSAAPQPNPTSVQVPPPLQAPAVSAAATPREVSQVMAEFDSLMARDPDEASANPARAAVPSPLRPSGSSDVNLPLVQRSATRADHPDNAEQVPVTAAGGATGDPSKAYTPPTGHWSTQGAIDDGGQPDGVVVSRDLAGAGGTVTSSHLVISTIPTSQDLLLPFSPTGEIMITGTIDLPLSLGTTGAHPARYDHSDVDTLLEASDREDSNVDSAPVRAIRAVSTHTSSRGLIGSGKQPRSGRLPMILAVSTAGAAAVVVGLFVAGFMLHMF